MNIQDLYPIIDDILYSKHVHIDIALPYYNKKKEVGPMLIQLFKDFGLHYKSRSPSEWHVLSENRKGYYKVINFITHSQAETNKGRANLIIIPNDKE